MKSLLRFAAPGLVAGLGMALGVMLLTGGASNWEASCVAGVGIGIGAILAALLRGSGG